MLNNVKKHYLTLNKIDYIFYLNKIISNNNNI